MNDLNSHPPKKTGRILFLGTIVVLLLALAAYVGGSLLRNQQAASENDDLIIVAAEGLPDSPFELIGGVISNEGNSLFVQVRQNQALGLIGGRGVEAGNDAGPPTEVVITHDTEFYRDAT